MSFIDLSEVYHKRLCIFNANIDKHVTDFESEVAFEKFEHDFFVEFFGAHHGEMATAANFREFLFSI